VGTQMPLLGVGRCCFDTGTNSKLAKLLKHLVCQLGAREEAKGPSRGPAEIGPRVGAAQH
jgi:hypothetical protein